MTKQSTVDETTRVRDYWEQASCGTDATARPKHSREYFEEIEAFRYEHEPFIHSFAQFTRAHGKRVLEVGVGAGSDFLQWVRAGAIATGVDLTDEGIENVKNRLEVYGLKAHELRRVNAEQLPFADGSFDLAYSWGVIHHASNMERVLGEIYRVVRPGGTVKIMVYNLHSLHTWYIYLRYALLAGKITRDRHWAIYNHQESYATKVYGERDIKRILAPHPHTDLKFEYYNQRIRRGARMEHIRRFLTEASPPRLKWYLGFSFTKQS